MTKVPSNKKVKDKIKIEHFLVKKRAAAAAAAGETDHETPEDTVLPDEVPGEPRQRHEDAAEQHGHCWPRQGDCREHSWLH